MREELFYKDATPKAEHFISFVVQLPLSRRRKGLAQSLSEAPLDLELMYAPSAPGEDYLPVPDQSHLRAAASLASRGEAVEAPVPFRSGEARAGRKERSAPTPRARGPRRAGSAASRRGETGTPRGRRSGRGSASRFATASNSGATARATGASSSGRPSRGRVRSGTAMGRRRPAPPGSCPRTRRRRGSRVRFRPRLDRVGPIVVAPVGQKTLGCRP